MSFLRRHRLLVFMDAVGITEGYKPLWHRLLTRVGITEQTVQVTLRSSYHHFSGKQHLEWKKTRKQPGFNTNLAMQARVKKWVQGVIEQHQPDLIVCFDPALLFLLNPDWSQATLDKLRGGLYIELGVPWVVTLPMTAYHTKAKSTDIAKLNQGFIEKGDFNDFQKELDYSSLDSPEDDEDSEDQETETDRRNEDSRMEWHEPIIIPFGKTVLRYDFEKVQRLLSRIPVEELTYRQLKE